MRKSVDVIFLSISNPFMVGIYEDKKLIDVLKSELKSSEALPVLYKQLEKLYNIKRVIYVNGPGSFMAIKVTYIFLKTISIIKNIPFFAIDAFYFNENQPIKAIAKLYFVKVSSKIETKKFNEHVESKFSFFNFLDESYLNKDTAPLYVIGAIGQ